MKADFRNIVVLGSTGSVGRSTLEVVEAVDNLGLLALSAHTRLDQALSNAGNTMFPF